MNNTVTDKFGNEIKCGDMVCFVQAGYLIRVKITALISTKTQDFIVYSDKLPKVPSSMVVKCY